MTHIQAKGCLTTSNVMSHFVFLGMKNKKVLFGQTLLIKGPLPSRPVMTRSRSGINIAIVPLLFALKKLGQTEGEKNYK